MFLGKGRIENFFDVMFDDGDLKDNIFSVVFSWVFDGINNGEIVFGYIDDEWYIGKIVYFDIVSGSNVWVIEFDEMVYNGKKVGIGGMKMYIDMGLIFIYGF